MSRIHHKFHAQASHSDGMRFDSKKERRYYEDLKLRQQAGDVVMFLRQVPFHLPGGVKYVVDFQEFLSDGTVRFVDVKGMQTAEFKTKKRMVEATYPVTIEVV